MMALRQAQCDNVEVSCVLFYLLYQGLQLIKSMSV